MRQAMSTLNEPAVAWLQHDCWQIAPWFILRTAGFPVELMSRLRFTATRQHIDQLLAAAGPPGESQTAWHAAAEQTFQAELAATTQHLREMAGTPRFREAVFLSNPANFSLIERWIDGHPQSPSKFRQGLLTTMLYLQRFCMKNDTASFFGPFVWGGFDPNYTHNITLVPGEGPSVQRTTFFSHWAAHRLAQWSSQFPSATAAIRPRRVPTMVLDQGRIRGLLPNNGRWQLVDEVVDLPPYATELLTLIDGAQTLDAIVAVGCARWHITPAELHATIKRLVDAQLVHAQIEVPVGPTTPLEYLKAELEQANVAEALPVIEQFIALRDAFATAPLAERQRLLTAMGELFEQTTNTIATRGAGAHYADRSLLYEDAVRDIAQCTVGGQLFQDVAQLDTLWELITIIQAWDEQFTQQTSTEWFRCRFPGQRVVPFLEYAQAFLADGQLLEERFSQNDHQLQTRLHQIFDLLIPAEAAHLPVIHMTLDDLRQRIAQLAPATTAGAVINPDFMVIAKSLADLNQGQYKLVLGEVHTAIDLLTHTPLTYGLPEVEREALRRFVSARYADIAAPDEWIVDVVRVHLRKTSAQLALEAPHIEAQGRSPKPRHEVVELSALEVHLAENGLRLYAPVWQRYLRLTSMRVPNGNTQHANLLRPFALSEHEGVIPMPQMINYHPRVEVGKIILLRRTWRVSYRDWHYTPTDDERGWSLGLFLHATRLRQALDLPERVFAKIVGETKPIFVDFSNYFLIHAFYKLWQKHQGVAIISEACPDIPDAWMEDDGGHYSCEFRVGFYRRGQHKKHQHPES